jgi:hypothetical protein
MAEHQQITRERKEKPGNEQRRRMDAEQLPHGHGSISGLDFSFNSPPDQHARLLAKLGSHSQRAGFLMQLQQTHGNRYVQRLIKPIAPQAKLIVNTPGDIYEQEADRVAEQVMRLPEPVVQAKPGWPFAKGASCGDKKATLQKKESSVQENAARDQSIDVPPIVYEVLHSSGQPLDPATRAFMEPRFGNDFSQVRVHTDAKATESAQTLNALAYTVGQDMVFGSGQYTPGTNAGQRLLAHELTHVIQQGAIATVSDRHHLKKKVVPLKSTAPLIQRHLTIQQSIDEFTKKFREPTLLPPGRYKPGKPLPTAGRSMVTEGQFYWSAALKQSIENRYKDVLIDSSWDFAEKDKLEKLFDKLLELSYEPRGQIAEINQTRQEIQKVLNNSKNSLASQLRQLLGNSGSATRDSGEGLFRTVWQQFRKSQAIPSLSFAQLQGLKTFEYAACYATAEQAAGYLSEKGGLSIGGRSPANKLPPVYLCTRVERRAMPTTTTENEGDVIKYGGGLDLAIRNLRKALDDNWVVRAAVLSGKATGGDKPEPQPWCKEEHYIVIIGYDDNEFVFWDPDPGASPGGFGHLFYDSNVPRFSTAQNSSDLAVDSAGVHHGQHRYQIIRMWSS